MHFHVQILLKSKVCIIHKDTPFLEKWQNFHGNVIHIANLLFSIEDASSGSSNEIKMV